MILQNVNRGNIYYVDLGQHNADSHVESGARPCVVVSNTGHNMNSPTVTVVPLAKVSNNRFSDIHPQIQLRQLSYALCEQIITIDKYRLERCIGSVTEPELKNIYESLKSHFGE